ncbi:MAG TPA: alpha/beta hydrolase, partial [Mycobacteriales bacterium]
MSRGAERVEGLPVRMADAGGHRLAYLETGDGSPVLLVPGYTGSKEDFGPVLAPLAVAGHRVVAFDMRGQLDSPGDGPAESYDPEGLATDLLALLARLDLRPAHVVGHSYGGIVAREAFLREPAAFASLTLLSSGPAAIRGARARLMTSLRGELVEGGVSRVSSLLRAAGGHESFDADRFDATDPVSLLGMGEALLSAPDRVLELAS